MIEVQFGDGSWCHHPVEVYHLLEYTGNKAKVAAAIAKVVRKVPVSDGMVGGMKMGKRGWLRMDIESVCKSLDSWPLSSLKLAFFGGSLRILNWVWLVLWHMFRKSSKKWPLTSPIKATPVVPEMVEMCGSWMFMAASHRVPRSDRVRSGFFLVQKGPRIQHGAQGHGGVSRGASRRPRKDPGETSQEIGLPEIKGFFSCFFPQENQENRLEMVHGIHIYVIFDPNG